MEQERSSSDLYTLKRVSELSLSDDEEGTIEDWHNFVDEFRQKNSGRVPSIKRILSN